MAGGLLNIVSVGNNNIILTGNPTKTFFNVTYSKYTNFGLQKFRIDYDGQRELIRNFCNPKLVYLDYKNFVLIMTDNVNYD